MSALLASLVIGMLILSGIVSIGYLFPSNRSE